MTICSSEIICLINKCRRFLLSWGLIVLVSPNHRRSEWPHKKQPLKTPCLLSRLSRGLKILVSWIQSLRRLTCILKSPIWSRLFYVWWFLRYGDIPVFFNLRCFIDVYLGYVPIFNHIQQRSNRHWTLYGKFKYIQLCHFYLMELFYLFICGINICKNCIYTKTRNNRLKIIIQPTVPEWIKQILPSKTSLL